MNRRDFLRCAAGAAATLPVLRANPGSPNVIFIFADDLGYGDLGCYGSKIPTPNLDQMASEGIRFRSFYSASPVCSASRAALLTGRYPVRSGINGVLFPDDNKGIPESETTIAQMLKWANYRTMCIGKWHLGAKPDFLPTNRGFDEFFGVPFSNDMYPLPLMRGTEVIANKAKLSLLTQQYTKEAVDFIGRSTDTPFFLYLAHTFPHIPIAASPEFRGKSGMGMYGDAVAEIDWSCGQILQALKDKGLDENTLVIFSSDNGPWYEGTAGRLRGRKGETWEGGMREPFIARFPGRIPPDRVTEAMGTMMDVLPTLARVCGAPLPGASLDGVNIWPILTGDAESVDRPLFLYFDGIHAQCARSGRWKLHVARYDAFPWVPGPPEGRFNLPLKHPELYDVASDPEEAFDVASDNPDVVNDIQTQIRDAMTTMPLNVQNARNYTLSLKVQDTPTGALPVRDYS
jgi:arylsulfatase